MGNLGAAGNLGMGESGESKEVMVDIVTNLVDNATIDLEHKFEALGVVGSSSGWTSEVTMAMMAKFIDEGLAWDDLEMLLRQFELSDTLIQEVRASLEPIIADEQSFNEFMMEPDTDKFPKDFKMGADRDAFENFKMKADAGDFNNFHMDYNGPYSIDLVGGGAASGGTFGPGWTGWVGEKGPELISLPDGGTVYPHGKSMQMANKENTSNGGMAQINLYVDGHLSQTEVVNLAEGVVKTYQNRDLKRHNLMT